MFIDKRMGIKRGDYSSDAVEYHTKRRPYKPKQEMVQEIEEESQEQQQQQQDTFELPPTDSYEEETVFLSHPNLDMPTIDGRYDDANLRVGKNYQQFLALSITTIAILGIASYKIGKK